MYKGAQNREEIIKILKKNKGGQSNEAIFVNYVWMMTDLHRGTKTQFPLLKDEEAKPIFQAALQRSLLTINTLLAKKNGDSLMSLIMEFMNMIKNTYVDEDGTLRLTVEELEGGQVGGMLMAFLAALLLFMIMSAVYNLAPVQTEEAFQAGVEGIKRRAGDVQRDFKHRLQYDGDRVKVKEEGDKLLTDFQNVEREGQDIRDQMEMMVVKKTGSILGALGNFIMSDEEEQKEIDRRINNYIKDVNTFLKKITDFAEKWEQNSDPKIKEKAAKNIEKILNHDDADILKLKTSDDVFILLKRLCGVTGNEFPTREEQIKAIFALFNDKDMFYKTFETDGETMELCPLERKEANKRDINTCIDINERIVLPELKDMYRQLQIEGPEKPATIMDSFPNFSNVFGSNSQPELKQMGENYYTLTQDTLGDTFISIVGSTNLKQTEMNKALDILSELKDTEIDRLKEAVENMDKNEFYTTDNNKQVIINEAKMNTFISSLSSLIIKLYDVMRNMKTLMHTDQKENTIRMLSAHRIKKLAQRDLNRRGEVYDITPGQNIEDYKDEMIKQTNKKINNKEDYDNVIKNTIEEVNDVVGKFSTYTTAVLTRGNKFLFKNDFITNLIEKKIPNNMRLNQDNLNKAIEVASQQAKERFDANTKMPADASELRDDNEYFGPTGGRRATKKRRKRNTTRNKHKAPRKTKSARRKTTRKKRVSKK
tara:strand:- start:320 stop:2446 length:2127 start_codon:yes stop_codon:yes gene_type:complete